MNLDSSLNMAVSTVLYILYNGVFNVCIGLGLYGRKNQPIGQFFKNHKLMLSLAFLNGVSYLAYNVAKQYMFGALVSLIGSILCLMAIQSATLRERIFQIAGLMLATPFIQLSTTLPVVLISRMQFLLTNTLEGYAITVYLIAANFLVYWGLNLLKGHHWLNRFKLTPYKQMLLLPLSSVFILMWLFFEYGRTMARSNQLLETIIFIGMSGFTIYISLRAMQEIKAELKVQQREAKQAVLRRLMESNLQKRHDIKNKLAAFDAFEVYDNLLIAMWHVKAAEIKVLGIAIEGSFVFTDVDRMDLKTEMNLATVLGILLDNGKEHLIANPHLPQVIVVGGQFDDKIWIQNALDGATRPKIGKFFKSGYTTKTNDVKAGYGLHNARDNANEIHADLQLVYEEATKQIQAILVFRKLSERS